MDCVSQWDGIRQMKGKGGGQGHLEKASPKNLKLALGTGMLGLQGTTAVKRNHETRKENTPRPTPTANSIHPLHLLRSLHSF